MSETAKNIPSVSVTYAQTGASMRANALGMRPMQERAFQKRGEQYLLIKSLKAIAASLLMEQVLAPRFEFRPKNANNAATTGYDYGEGGYDPNKCNLGVNPETGRIQLEIKGLAEPKSQEAERICREDLNELITAFVQDKTTVERGMFDQELVPEELTQVRMGKIVKEKFPGLGEEDQEAVRQHAIAALNLVQAAKKELLGGAAAGSDAAATPNTSLIDGVRKYALSVTELDIDLIDRINPFGEAYEILAKSMTPERLKVVMEVIYVLRSKSDDPFVAKNRSVLHKIGVTGGDVKSRVANARKDPTYLLADVEIVATFKLANINRQRLEALLHKFFGKARLDLELKDRFGGQVEPREWFWCRSG